MDKRRKQLCEILLRFIDIQIKKYVKLTEIGVGPDASMNALLVAEQTRELLSYADTLISDDKITPASFDTIYCQIKFYLDHEFLRGKVAWLIDENNIHNVEFTRLREQSQVLATFAQTWSIDYDLSTLSLTANQRSCRHDSYEIALYILEVAEILKKDPNATLTKHIIPSHACNATPA